MSGWMDEWTNEKSKAVDVHKSSSPNKLFSGLNKFHGVTETVKVVPSSGKTQKKK